MNYIYPEQRFPDLVNTAEYDRGEVDLREGGGGGCDGGDDSAAGEVHDGGVQKDGGNREGGKNNHQPQYLST